MSKPFDFVSLFIDNEYFTGMETKKRKQYKPISRPQAIKQADTYFSHYIRLRDSNEQGIGRCITCNKSVDWKNAHCGHYISRRHFAVRYHLDNCHLQCEECNVHKGGNLEEYRKVLNHIFGHDKVEYLEIMSRGARKYTMVDLEETAKDYKRMSENLKEKKGL